MAAPAPKTYAVTDVHGTVSVIDADWLFDNQGTLVFRVGERGNTEVVATYGPGQWTSCVRLQKKASADAGA